KGGTIWEKQCGKQVGDPHRLIGTAGCETRMPSGVRGVGESFPYSILSVAEKIKPRFLGEVLS
ncbi:hypothetical protein, partial [Parasutterella excrementihominis]|uniref:hypothetical protein n=1 Tax=Parasutterella excrementihominis TaxID=487175 RepID=UPI00272D8391